MNRFKRVAHRITDNMDECTFDEADRVWDEFSDRFGGRFIGREPEISDLLCAVRGEFEDLVHKYCEDV